MIATLNDLPEATRKAIAELLNAHLAGLIDLQLQAKQAHWNVKGPNFIALHELFDDIAEGLEVLVDDTAERIVALGGTADGTIDGVKAKTKLPAYPTTITSSKEHVQAFAKAISLVGKAARAGIDEAAKLGDQGTADLLTGASRELDKKLWFVESHSAG